MQTFDDLLLFMVIGLIFYFIFMSGYRIGQHEGNKKYKELFDLSENDK